MDITNSLAIFWLDNSLPDVYDKLQHDSNVFESVKRSHVFNLRRALKDRSASQELAGDIKSSLSSYSTAGTCTLHLVPFHGIPLSVQLSKVSYNDAHTFVVLCQVQSHIVLNSL